MDHYLILKKNNGGRVGNGMGGGGEVIRGRANA